MYQVYFLSLVTLVASSVSLGFDRLDEQLHIGSLFSRDFVTRASFRLGLGVVTLLVGFFQFLTVAPGDVPVVGDLVPALTGMVLGATLVLVYYQEHAEVESPFVERLDRLLVRNASNLAYVGLLVAVLHFFLHRVLFL